jgi:GTP-binding protein HflX
VLSDTVGFVRDLPHQLVAAFRATLEETAEADLLLHVVDAAAPDRPEQVEQVERVLAEIDADRVPHWLVLNKIDAAGLAPEVQLDACDNIERLSVSARTGAGLDALRRALQSAATLARSDRSERIPGDSTDDRVDRKVHGSDDDESVDPPAPGDAVVRPPSEQHLPNGMPDVDPHSHSVVAQ